MVVSLDQAELVGLSIEALLYGIYLILWPVSVYALFIRHARQSEKRPLANKILIYGEFILFSLVTSHLVLDISRMWSAFITHQSEPEGPLVFYSDLGEPRNVARMAIFTIEILILDTLLLYRLLIIWSYNFWVLVAPASTFAGQFVAGVQLCRGYANANPSLPRSDFPSNWITAALSLSLATNILAVGLIAFKILSSNRRLRATGAQKVRLSPTQSTIRIIIESAGLYCLVNVIILIPLASGNGAWQLAVIDAASPISGISFSLITFRVGLRHSLAYRFSRNADIVGITEQEQRAKHSPVSPLGRLLPPQRTPHVETMDRISHESDMHLARGDEESATSMEMARDKKPPMVSQHPARQER